MEQAQARYKRAFDKRVQTRREALQVGDWVFVKSHENQWGKLVFKTLGPYQILKTDGRRLTIESDDGIRTINWNHATRAPEPPEKDPAWARALTAWRVPSLPSSASKPIEAVFDRFVGQGYDNQERLMLKVRWIGYGPREDSWHYVEDLPTEKVRQHCAWHVHDEKKGKIQLKTPSTGYPSHTTPKIDPTQLGTSTMGAGLPKTERLAPHSNPGTYSRPGECGRSSRTYPPNWS